MYEIQTMNRELAIEIHEFKTYVDCTKAYWDFIENNSYLTVDIL